MNIEALRTFVEVVDAGGISPAARRLGAPKSVISRRLMRLEEELGVRLVARTTRGAELTDVGAIFLNHAESVCDEIDLAREAILPSGELRGQLRVAVPLTFGPTQFASVLARMALLHPHLHVHACYTDRFVDLIAEGFDCGIRVGTLVDSNLLAKRIGPIFGQCVASPDYIHANGSPETPYDLLAHEALMQGTESWQFMDGDKIITLRPHGRFKADSGVALVDAAIAGLGVARAPDGLIIDHIASGKLVPVLTRYPPPPAGAYVVRPPSHFLTRKIRVLTEMLIECFDNLPQDKTEMQLD
jgi:DNA-binding transcriptional LysR family regulator